MLILGFFGIFAVAGCVSPPVIAPVAGNGHCHPSDDLPPHKSVPKAPETATPWDEFYNMVVDWRKAWAQDDRDYNSLYNQCVDKGPAK
jgi:hypothetical protein